jgi:hypothetical protein
MTDYRLLAPNPGTLQRAEDLANPRKWIIAERNERALWGEIGNPYQVIVDLHGPAFKCSCPVKIFPCKHALALLLLHQSSDEKTFGTNPMPDWVSKWIDDRDKRLNKLVAKDVAADPVADAKNEATRDKNKKERIELMSEGVTYLENQLTDIIRQGLDETLKGGRAFFNNFAARLVDYKLGGLAKRVKGLVPNNGSSDIDLEHVLDALGLLYLYTKAFKSIDLLPENLQEELLTQSGITIKKEGLLSQDGTTDDWFAIAQVISQEEDNLESRRTWLYGKSTEMIVLFLDFSFMGGGYSTSMLLGQTYTAEIVFYPSSFPQRVLLKTQIPCAINPVVKTEQNFDVALGNYAKALSLNPWLVSFPMLLAEVRAIKQEDKLILIDKNQHIVPLSEMTEAKYWQVLSLSATGAFGVFGEWNGSELALLSVIKNDRWIPIL